MQPLHAQLPKHPMCQLVAQVQRRDGVHDAGLAGKQHGLVDDATDESWVSGNRGSGHSCSLR